MMQRKEIAKYIKYTLECCISSLDSYDETEDYEYIEKFKYWQNKAYKSADNFKTEKKRTDVYFCKEYVESLLLCIKYSRSHLYNYIDTSNSDYIYGCKCNIETAIEYVDQIISQEEIYENSHN